MTEMNLDRRRFVALALPLAAAACSASPNPVLYTIETRPGPTFAAGPKVVILRDISLASYLDCREIVRSSEDYKLGVMSNDWWGESLGALLAGVLVVELSQRLPDSKVYGESAPSRQIPTRPSASIFSASMPTKRASSCCLPK
jgi:uncharacterized lipoprotein YmbA